MSQKTTVLGFSVGSGRSVRVMPYCPISVSRATSTHAECGRGGVVDEAQDVEVCDLGGVEDRAPLRIRVPARDRDDDVVDRFDLSRGGVAQAAEQHGVKLGNGERRRLAEVVDLTGQHSFRRRRRTVKPI